MNELKDLIEVAGNIVEEAERIGRKKAARELSSGKEVERLQAEIDALNVELDEVSVENERLRDTIDKLRELLGV